MEEGGGKRGRGRGRGTRARGNRGRGRGRGRGKKTMRSSSSDEETSLDQQSPDVVACNVSEDADVSTGSGTTTIIPTEINDGANLNEPNKENVIENTQATPVTPLVIGSQTTVISPPNIMAATTLAPLDGPLQPCVIPQTIDMEADISQLEAPTFTTISRGPPEPMLRLKWDHKVSLIGEKVLNPMIHCCDQCAKPILLYGRMIPCKHVFCLKCARAEPIKICPRCNDKVVRVEQSGLGTVFMCTHGGSRYGNTGCRRTYLSQRDLQAHINHRHVTQPPLLPPTAMQAANEIKQDIGMDTIKNVSGQRKISESSTATTTIQAPSTLLIQRPRTSSNIGSIPPPGSNTTTVSQNTTHSHSSLTQANIARINTANAQDCHQGKVALHQTLKKTPITQSHHQQPETVADASYYSSVLNSFGSAVGGNSGSSGGGGSNATGGGGGVGGVGVSGSNLSGNSQTAASVGYSYDPSAGGQTGQSSQNNWQQNQYYR